MKKYGIVDTIVSVPWQDTECGDDTGWRLGTYWFSGEDDYPYTYDEVSDGDHEPESDLPSDEDVAESWKRYHEWCLEEGRDPLGEYTGVARTQRLPRTYHVSFLATIVGVRGSRSESGARYRLKLSGYISVPRADVDQFDPVRDGWVGRDGRP